MSRLLRARLVDVSRALALKGAGSQPGKATRLWKSRGSGLRKWESASGSALGCEPLSPEAEGIGPGPLPPTLTPPHRVAAGCEASPGGPPALGGLSAARPQPRRRRSPLAAPPEPSVCTPRKPWRRRTPGNRAGPGKPTAVSIAVRK